MAANASRRGAREPGLIWIYRPVSVGQIAKSPADGESSSTVARQWPLGGHRIAATPRVSGGMVSRTDLGLWYFEGFAFIVVV
jgi:hypothetical protein